MGRPLAVGKHRWRLHGDLIIYHNITPLSFNAPEMQVRHVCYTSPRNIVNIMRGGGYGFNLAPYDHQIYIEGFAGGAVKGEILSLLFQLEGHHSCLKGCAGLQ